MQSRLVLTLATLAGFLVATPGLAEPDQRRVREELKSVFDRPEFQKSNQPREPSWLLRLLRWLEEMLGKLHVELPGLFWLLLIGGVGLLLLLLVHIATVLRHSAYVRRKGSEDAQAEIRRQLSANLRAEADELARTGDYTAAVRCLFLSLVHAFDESGRFLFQAALTNREYLQGFAGRAVLESGLGTFVDMLDDNWYGQQPTTVHQFGQCLELYEQLRSLA